MQQVEREEIDIIMEEYSPKPVDGEPKFDTMDASASFHESRGKPRSAILARPGRFYPSRFTSEKYYDCCNKNRGLAVIFNHVNFKKESTRRGSDKDAQDFELVLKDLGFTVQIHRDKTKDEIKKILMQISNMDHTDNDCFLLVMMSHGGSDGKIYAHDKEYLAQELWENFLGNNCESLIGKPKLFFIQACRGKLVDPGVLFQKPKIASRRIIVDHVDATREEDEEFVIPVLADLLIMYSTSEGYYSFRNQDEGSWFIQSLLTELKENSQEELMTILTAVNRRVAYAYQSNMPKSKMDASKQMPNIVSMLTKGFYFTPKLSDIERKNISNSIPNAPEIPKGILLG